MATERRRWFYVADSVLREPWPNDVLATFIRLLAYLNQRRSRDRLDPDAACQAVIGKADLMAITGKLRLDVARTSLSRLAHVTSTSVEHQADVTLISWPNCAEFQGWLSDFRVDETRHRPPPVSGAPEHLLGGDSHSLIPPKKERSRSARSAPNGRGKIPMPEALNETERERLVLWCQKRGLAAQAAKYATQSVRDWAYANDRRKADWVRTIQSAIRAGWALEGCPLAYRRPNGQPDRA